MRKKARQALHNIRVFFIVRMSRIPRYTMFTISGIFFLGFILQLFGISFIFDQWEIHEKLLVMTTSFITGMSLYLSAPNPKIDPY